MHSEELLYRLWNLGARLVMGETGWRLTSEKPIPADLLAELKQHKAELTIPLVLGMKRDQAVQLWQDIGSPAITMKDGHIRDLAVFLASQGIQPADLASIRRWFEEAF